jgi:integrase
MQSQINSLTELIERARVEDYTGWYLEARKGQGDSLVNNFRMIFAAVKQHPKYASLDLKWVPEFIDGIPIEPAATVKDRRASRCVHFSVLEPVPSMIHVERLAAEKRQLRDQQHASNTDSDEKQRAADEKRTYEIARLAMEELLMKWILFLPMRQRNIRELLLGKNLFRRPIPPFQNITIPDWAKEELRKNPAAEFWQFKFEPRNTKKDNGVHCVLPWALIQLLEEYLTNYRPHLVLGPDPETLFLNQNGNPIGDSQMTAAIGTLTLRYAGTRITPHSIRHIAAYRWLELNPKDYLTLSKMLWHASVDVTLRVYGEEFNESDGVCMWEQMLDKGPSDAV